MLARDVVVGTRTLAAYRAGRADRQKKLAALLNDPAQQEALLRGDADGDLVPDAMDQCPKTPAGAPTDARGCQAITNQQGFNLAVAKVAGQPPGSPWSPFVTQGPAPGGVDG